MTKELPELPEPLKEMLREHTKGMLSEYEHGFKDAHSVISASLNASLAKAKNMSKAEPYILGMSMAVAIVDEVKKELLDLVKKNTDIALEKIDAKN